MIPVTRPFLPPQEDYEDFLNGIWESELLTNNGPLVQEMEERLKSVLKTKYLQVVTNGTIALQLSIRALEVTGEVITTPYSYVATTSSILWERCKPKFVDIRAEDFCIDPDKIEDAITDRTTAIIATHVYGLPCNVDKIEAIARTHGLRVIYDAAHAFGVEWKGKALASYGEMATLSFHATKVFHSVEGGAIVTNDPIVNEKIFLAKAFGHKGDRHFQLGINGKLSEFHAAMGLCVLEHFEEIVQQRMERWMAYKDLLANCMITINLSEGLKYNYGYFPVVFESETRMLKVIQRLSQDGIGSRRYFYPSLNKLPYLTSTENCPVSESLSERVLCLPLYHDLSLRDIEFIANIIKSTV